MVESKDGQRFLAENEAVEVGRATSSTRSARCRRSCEYRSPNEIFDTYGADALRWYFFSNQAPWNSIIYSEQAIKDCIPGFLLRLWNVFSFFTIYANIDAFEPAAEIAGDAGQLESARLARAASYRPPAQRGELDRWILSELNRTAAAVAAAMDAYDNYGACSRLNAFVDALSNWYVRRSRDRFWSGGVSDEKTDGYWTLFECLITTARGSRRASTSATTRPAPRS